MEIIINHSSMQPIYEQIVHQIKSGILQGKLPEESMLPSVRGMARDLKISALTVKKAYDALEEEGYIVTVHGKGSFVASVNPRQRMEESQKKVEEQMQKTIEMGKTLGLDTKKIREIFEILIDDSEWR